MTDEELAGAWRRILNDRPISGDGERALLWLRRRLIEVPPMGAETCAVHDHNGQRRLAATLIGFAVTEDDAADERRDAGADLAFERGRQRGFAEQRAAARRRRSGSGRRVPVD